MSAGPSDKTTTKRWRLPCPGSREIYSLWAESPHADVQYDLHTDGEHCPFGCGNKHCRKLHTVLVTLDAQVWIQTKCSSFISSFSMFFSPSQPPACTDICTLAFYFMLLHCCSPCGNLYTPKITQTSINQLLLDIVYAIEIVLLGWNYYLSYVWALRKTPVKLVICRGLISS